MSRGDPAVTRAFAYQPALDGVRALAVVAVMLYHGGAGVAKGGFLGVDVFFVLSGYLITSLLLAEHDNTGTISLRAFWLRRARRLFPALVLMLLGVALYAAVWAIPPELARLRGDAFATLGYVANWRQILTHQSYFERFRLPSPLLHTWSLAIEEQWYLLWPATCLLVLRRRAGHAALAVLAGAVAIASAVAMALLFHQGHDPTRVYYGTDTRAFELVVGALLALALRQVAARRWRAPRSVSLTVGLVGAAVLVAMINRVGDHSARLYRGGFMLAALASAALMASLHTSPRGLVARAFAARPLVAVGRISYGLYLWHWPVDVVATQARAHTSGNRLLALRFAVTLALAIVSYFSVERPIRSGGLAGWRFGRFEPLRRPAVALPVVAAVVAGALLWASAGAQSFPDYYTAAVRKRLAADKREGIPRVLVAGDSTAFTFAGRADLAPVSRVRWDWIAHLGCGVQHLPNQPNAHNTPACAAWPQEWAAKVAAYDPDLVLLMIGAWEVLDHYDGARKIAAGTPEWTGALDADLETARRVLTRGGARLVILDVPCYGQATGPPEELVRNDPARTRAVNEVIAGFVARHRDVGALAWSQRICPQGRYAAKIDGVTVRDDGVHFTAGGASLVLRDIAPTILRDADAAMAARHSSKTSG